MGMRPHDRVSHCIQERSIACIYIGPRHGATVLRLWHREGRGEFYMTYLQVALSRPHDAFTKPPGCIWIPGVGKYLSFWVMRYVTAVRALDTFVTTCLQKAVGGGGGKWCSGILCTFFCFRLSFCGFTFFFVSRRALSRSST